MDSLRAIAALAIVAYHVAPLAGALRSELATDLTAQLSSGVALFFLISGFLLYARSCSPTPVGSACRDVRAYAWRRFLRIVPAYWAALTVAGLTFGPGGLRQAAALLRVRQIYSPGAVL